jgi:hypothetical protein
MGDCRAGGSFCDGNRRWAHLDLTLHSHISSNIRARSIHKQLSIQRYANMSVEPITNTAAEAADQKSAPEIDDKFGRKVRLDRDIS